MRLIPPLPRNLSRALCFLFLAGCASVPNVEPLLNRPADGPPVIMGARGPLAPKQIAALLKKKGITGDQFTALERHLVIEEEVADKPLVAGNTVKVLRDGEKTFRAMFEAVRDAKQNVNLEYYIFEDVQSDGEFLGDLLLAKQANGVPVHVIYDSLGSGGTPGAFFQKLKDGGIVMVAFNPLNPFKAKAGFKPNDRDHRKILVADGRRAIVGGVNLSADYQSGSVPKSGGRGKKPDESAAAASGTPPAKKADYWRDTDLEITGPVVAQLQRLFFEHWAEQKGPPLDEAQFFPTVPATGTEIVRTIGSAPKGWAPRYYVTLLSAIRTAEKTIRINAAYFVPTRQEKKDLEAAARRGVDVRLLLPGKSDSHLALSVQHSYYEDLFEAGVKVYETQDAILHAKSVTVDGVWSVVGSSNLDHRSVLFNDEVDAVVVGRETAVALEKVFEDEAAQAVLVDPALWKQRPFSSRINDGLSRIWQSLL